MQRNIARLEAMWASDGIEVDANGPRWEGWSAIRARYLNEFNFSYSVENTNVRVQIAGDTAIAISDLRYNDTLRKDQDKWTFRKIGDQWKISSLTFNLAK